MSHLSWLCLFARVKQIGRGQFFGVFLKLMFCLGIAISTVSASSSPVLAEDPIDAINKTAEEQGVLDDAKVDSAASAAAAFTSNMAARGFVTLYKWLDLKTDPEVNKKNSWFISQYALIWQIALWILLPLLFISLIQAVAKGSLRQALISFFVYLPVSILGSLVAVEIVQLAIIITNEISQIFLQSLNVDIYQFGQDLMGGFATGGNQAPWLVTLILGILMIAAAFSLLFILVMREASIYIATLFLPIMFVMLVWPATARYFGAHVRFIFSLILSKIVIVAALSLGVAGLAASQGIVDSTAMTVSPSGNEVVQELHDTPITGTMEWWSKTTGFIGMLFAASFSPWLVNGIIGHIGMGDTGATTSAILTRSQVQPFVHGLDRFRNMSHTAKSIVIKK